MANLYPYRNRFQGNNWFYQITVEDDVIISGDLTVSGTFTFGDAATDSLTVTGLFNQTYSGTSDGHLVTGSGNLTAGKDLVRFSSTGSLSSTSNVLAIEQSTGAGSAGAYALYISATGTNVEALKVDDGTATFDEAVTIGGALQINSTVTVGVNDTGYDVTFYGATSGKSFLWDESADKLIITGDYAITGNSQFTGTVTVGVNDTGHDVQFFGATSGASLLWDESADALILGGAAGLQIGAAAQAVRFTGNVTEVFSVEGTSTAVLRIEGAATQLLSFDAVEGCLSTQTGGTATWSHKVLVNIDGVGSVYIPLAASFA